VAFLQTFVETMCHEQNTRPLSSNVLEHTIAVIQLVLAQISIVGFP